MQSGRVHSWFTQPRLTVSGILADRLTGAPVLRFRLLIVILCVAPFAGPAAAEACLDDWGKAGQIIRQEKLVTIEELSPLALRKGAGDILKSSLCDEQGRYVYRLVVRDPSGRLKNISVDARKPFER